eukprot:1756009-Alexandrium_andersonii.AAC.1
MVLVLVLDPLLGPRLHPGTVCSTTGKGTGGAPSCPYRASAAFSSPCPRRCERGQPLGCQSPTRPAPT